MKHKDIQVGMLVRVAQWAMPVAAKERLPWIFTGKSVCVSAGPHVVVFVKNCTANTTIVIVLADNKFIWVLPSELYEATP